MGGSRGGEQRVHTPPPSQHDQQLPKIYSILKNKNKRKQKKKTWLKSLGSDARPPKNSWICPWESFKLKGSDRVGQSANRIRGSAGLRGL